MIPQPQTVLHEPALRRPGNCFAACIASILEVPVSGVPAPGTEDFDHWSNYWPRLAEWLHGRGMAIVQIQFDEPVQAYQTFWTSTSCLDDPGPYYISSGNSPRGTIHAVVCRDGRLVHDPHPDGSGLLDSTMVDYLVPLHGERGAP